VHPEDPRYQQYIGKVWTGGVEEVGGRIRLLLCADEGEGTGF
jgi:hypothetical protein